VEWIHLAQDGDRWRAVVSAVMNLRVLVPQSYSCNTVYWNAVTCSERFRSGWAGTCLRA
jgi:hypothetical protein